MTHIKSAEGYDVKVPSQGEVTYGTVAGSLGIASFLGLNANNLLGGVLGNRHGGGYSPADVPVTRYELAMQQEIASKDSKIALLEANTYNDQKTLELYRYIDGKLTLLHRLSEIRHSMMHSHLLISSSLRQLHLRLRGANALTARS